MFDFSNDDFQVLSQPDALTKKCVNQQVFKISLIFFYIVSNQITPLVYTGCPKKHETPCLLNILANFQIVFFSPEN